MLKKLRHGLRVVSGAFNGQVELLCNYGDTRKQLPIAASSSSLIFSTLGSVFRPSVTFLQHPAYVTAHAGYRPLLSIPRSVAAFAVTALITQASLVGHTGKRIFEKTPPRMLAWDRLLECLWQVCGLCLHACRGLSYLRRWEWE